MPELPEVETVKNDLSRHLKGRTIVSALVLRTDSIAHPNSKQFCKLLPGHTFQNFERRGKYILCHLDKGAGLAAHLRMSGRLLIVDSNHPADRHLRVRIRLDNGQELHFEDTRVFGRLWFKSRKESFEKIVPALALLGPEPLGELSTNFLLKAFAKRQRPIKSALLDQTIIAGIGNIYADESLFLAGIHPLTPCGKLKKNQLEKLIADVRQVLNKAIELGGSSLRDYRSSMGVNGEYQGEAFVYGRNNEPCRRCKTKIQRLKLAGRSSHFCSRCQKL